MQMTQETEQSISNSILCVKTFLKMTSKLRSNSRFFSANPEIKGSFNGKILWWMYYAVMNASYVFLSGAIKTKVHFLVTVVMKKAFRAMQ